MTAPATLNRTARPPLPLDKRTGAPGDPRPPRRRNVVAVASGKGGVGKTWFSITLAQALARLGRRILLVDSDLGLANVDIQLGLMPERTVNKAIAGTMTLRQSVTPFAAGGFDILAGLSGSASLAALSRDKLAALASDIAALAGDYDETVLDLGAGVDRTVQTLSRVAGRAIVLTTDEPTALTDAYAFIKLATAAGNGPAIAVAVNMAPTLAEGQHTYGTLKRACEGFLNLTPELLGVIRRDPRVRDAIRAQTPLLTRFPNSDAARDMVAIAARVATEPTAAETADGAR